MARSYVAGYLGKAHYLSGDIGAASSVLEEACRVSWEVNHIFGLFLVIPDLAHLHILQGHLHQADQTYRQALQQVLELSGYQPAMGPAYVGRGNLEREWNHLDAADIPAPGRDQALRTDREYAGDPAGVTSG